MTQEDHNPKTVTAIRVSTAWLSIVAIIVYHILLTSMIFIRPDLDPYWHTISEYAIGPFGWIMTLAFWSAAVSYSLLFVAIRSQVSGIVGMLGLSVLIICTLGLFGVGIFRTDPLTTLPENMTATGILHLISGASQLMLLPFAAALININLIRKNPEWKAARLPLILTAFLPLAGLIGFMAHFVIFLVPLGENAYGPGVPIGWPPRFMFLTYMVWVVTLAWQAVKLRKQA